MLFQLFSSVAAYLKELLSAAHIDGLKLGLVQTAYANGSSTNYITKKLVSWNNLQPYQRSMKISFYNTERSCDMRANRREAPTPRRPRL